MGHGSVVLIVLFLVGVKMHNSSRASKDLLKTRQSQKQDHATDNGNKPKRNSQLIRI